MFCRAYNGNRIAVRFEYEYHDADGKWFRAHGNEVLLFPCLALHLPPTGQHLSLLAELHHLLRACWLMP